jgi:hypothetical protein
MQKVFDVKMRLGVSPPGLSVGALHGLTRFSVCSIRAFSFFSRGFEGGLHGLLLRFFGENGIVHRMCIFKRFRFLGCVFCSLNTLDPKIKCFHQSKSKKCLVNLTIIFAQIISVLQ